MLVLADPSQLRDFDPAASLPPADFKDTAMRVDRTTGVSLEPIPVKSVMAALAPSDRFAALGRAKEQAA